MRVCSLRRDGYQLKPLEVEVSLIPGLPSIQILGLPDQAIKESALRIRSAFRSLSLPFPKAHKVIVNLRPSHVRKQSRGLEFAIAAALLWEMEAFAKPESTPILYGELNLKGGVEAPSDMQDLFDVPEEHSIWSGVPGERFRAEFPLHSVSDLTRLDRPMLRPADQSIRCLAGPTDLDDLVLDEDDAQLVQLAAVGEHPVLLAGPQGVGKTTMAKVIHRLLPPVENDVFQRARAIHHLDGRRLQYRPLISPHHTASSVSIVGGGSQAKHGDFSRAHGGVLLLDEYLLFSPLVLEALREPMESGSVRVSRNAMAHVYPARALVLATTNLCPCGKWLPGKTPECIHSMRRCQSHLDRLSGPMLDRFAVLYFCRPSKNSASKKGSDESKTSNGKVRISDMREKVLAAREFAERRRYCNQQLTEKEIIPLTEKRVFELLPQLPHRRLLSLLRVARTLADLERVGQIQLTHAKQAMKLTVSSFHLLERGMGC